MKDNYKVKDEIVEWVLFYLNMSALLGIIPGLILRVLHPKISAILGGLFVTLSQVMTVFLVRGNRNSLNDESHFLLFTICFLAGQGSLLVLFASLQALLNAQTIQCTHVVCGCLISYYCGADSLIHALRMGLFKSTNLPSFVAFLAISALVLTLLNGSMISDEQGSKGFFAK